MDKLKLQVYRPQIQAKIRKKAFSPLRIESITEQLRQICYSGYTKILEIGIGIGFLRHCFKLFQQVHHTTLDIAEDRAPDCVGSVTSIPFANNEFDLTLCCEVLEHLRFDDFPKALAEIRRVTRHKVIMSLPDKTRRLGIAIARARWGWLVLEWNQPRRRYACKEFKFDGEHYWEIGCKGTLLQDIFKQMEKAGFKIEKHYRLWKHPWHHFFILKV